VPDAMKPRKIAVGGPARLAAVQDEPANKDERSADAA
jgi:hypothetical protein